MSRLSSSRPVLVGALLAFFHMPSYGQEGPALRAPAGGRAPSPEALVPADVLARVELIRDELELVRLEMGRPESGQLSIAVANVEPREVIFQAFTLFRRVNQLHYELTGLPGAHIEVRLPEEIQPFDVWQVVDPAYEQLLAVKRELGITQQLAEIARDPATTPADVFRAIVSANRQLDQLVSRPLSSNDVFHQVKLASHYASRLLAQFSGTELLPEPPARQRGKRPAEVYALLIECYGRLRTVAAASEIETLKIDLPGLSASAAFSPEVRPGDVHDVAILLVSELAYLSAQLEENNTAPQTAYDLDLKLPSHVYQRGEILLAQLRELESHTRSDPTWLSRRLGPPADDRSSAQVTGASVEP